MRIRKKQTKIIKLE